jgi:beta-lactamase class A
MRPETPELDDRDALANYLDDYDDRTDGRLGVFLGFADGPDDFDVVYERRAGEAFTSASVIKLPLAYALLERYDGDLDGLAARRGIAPENRVGGAGLFHLLDDPEPTLEDLLRAMIAISDNAATNELIDVVGLDGVREACETLGMTETRLRRKLMATLGDNDLETPDLDLAPDEPANTTSPADCARFFGDLRNEATLSPAAYERLRVPLREQKYGDAFPRYLPYEADVLHKTGWVPSAALDAGLVSPPGESDGGERSDGAGAESGDDDAAGDPLVFAVFVDRLENGGDGSDVIAEVGDAVWSWLASGGARR